MSASEKLKALEAAPKATAADVGAAWALRNALPQIVAVVEATEQLIIEDSLSAIQAGDDRNGVAATQAILALTALEEALS